jgi:hypothetical protein
MAFLEVTDANGNKVKVDVVARTENGETVYSQAMATIDPPTGNVLKPNADGSLKLDASQVSALTPPAAITGFSTEGTLAALAATAESIEAAAAAIQSAVEALNTKTAAVDTSNISGSVAVAGSVEITNDAGNAIPVSQAGAATAANQVAGNASLSNIDGKLPALVAREAGGNLEAISVDLGAPADAAATNDTGTWSITALIKRLFSRLPLLATTTPANNASGVPVRAIGEDIWNVSFSEVGASVLSPEFITPIAGAGVTYGQASGSQNIVAGTTPNAEFFTRSLQTWQGSLRLRFATVASQRIINNNFAVMLADLIGEGLSVTINSATSITVAQNGHPFTSQSVGQFVHIGGIAGGAAGVPGRYAIASVVPGVSYNLTVAGWPASGSCTATVFGHSYVRNLFNGTTATNVNFDTQRRGWAAGDTVATINTTASPGTVIVNELTGRECYLWDQLRATSTTPTLTTRASRVENLPDDNLSLYVFVWSFNGTTAPASSTTFSLSFCAVEKFANHPVYLQGMRAQGAVNPLPVQTQGTVPVSMATNTPALAASVNRAGFLAGAGIWYDDSATALGANATFTGTSRDLTVTATATAFANAATYAEEFRASAESDVAGTLWLEVSRDNVNWRRVKSVATAAVAGGGQYAEILHAPSWRYARTGFTNGAVAQARFSIGSILTAI